MSCMKLLCCRSLVIVGLVLPHLQNYESVATAQSDDTQIWQASDPTTLLTLLIRRDAEFDRRSMVIDKAWSEQVSPSQRITDIAFADLKFGQRTSSILREGEKTPDDYRQPYAWRYRMTVRDSEIVLENLASLKPVKDSRFSYMRTSRSRLSRFQTVCPTNCSRKR